jgi:hypothetical protein
MTKNEVNIKDIIFEESKLAPTKFGKDCTNSSLFLMYMIGYKIFNMPPNFVNAFVNDRQHRHNYNRPILFLFRVNDINYQHRDKSWSYFEEAMRNHSQFIEYYYAGHDGNHDLVMYVFEAPEIFHEDYDRFLEGKYSEFSLAFQDVFPKTVILPNKSAVQPLLHYRVIQKDPVLKKQIEDIIDVDLPDSAELWDKPDVYGRETYRS